jgi:hypothetical protein
LRGRQVDFLGLVASPGVILLFGVKKFYFVTKISVFIVFLLLYFGCMFITVDYLGVLIFQGILEYYLNLYGRLNNAVITI